MKIKANKITQKIAIVLICLLMFNFIAPTHVSNADVGGVLFSPIKALVLAVGDTATHMLELCFYGKWTDVILEDLCKWKNEDEDYNMWDGTDSDGVITYPVIKLSPEMIFANKVELFNINFISKLNPDDYEVKSDDTTSSIEALRKTISGWYVAIRNLSLVAMLSILVYIGIRIVLSTTAENKAKYKQFLVDWAVGLCLLFVMHYGMAFLNLFIDKLTSSLSSITTQVYSQAIKAGDNWDDIKRGLNEIQDEQGGFSWTEIDSADQLGKSGATVEVLKVGKGDDNKYLYVQTNLMGEIRMGTQYAKNQSEGFIGWTVMFIMMVIFLVIFIWMYLKRVMYMAFLTLMAPFVAVTYPLDKIKDGKAQGFDYWFKEYFYNLLLQPLHLLIYTVLVGTATEVAIENPIYGIAALAFLLPAEKILKQMFGFKGETSSGLSQFAGHAMGYNLLQKAFGGLGPGKSSNKAIDSGDSGSGGNSNGSGQGSKINWNKAPGSSQSSSGGQGGGGSSRATIAGVIANKVKPQNTAKRQLKGKRGTPFKLQSAGKKLSGAKPGFFNNLANGSRDVSKAFGRLKGRAGNSKLGRKVSALGQTRGGRAFSAVGRTMGSSAKRKLKNGFKKTYKIAC